MSSILERLRFAAKYYIACVAEERKEKNSFDKIQTCARNSPRDGDLRALETQAVKALNRATDERRAAEHNLAVAIQEAESQTLKTSIRDTCR